MKRKLQQLGLFAVLMLTALSQLSAQVITMTTTKKVGETIGLRIDGEGEISIEGVKEAFQPSSGPYNIGIYTLTSQTIKIRGKVTELNCSDNQLSRLDVSGCTALTELKCYDNQLSRLDISKNTALTKLSCSDNQLSRLDISKNTALTKLSCSDNQLSRLDISKNTALTELECSDNRLIRLDVSKNTALTKLRCSDNQLSSLDLSQNMDLVEVYCFNNLLTNLEIPTSKKLKQLKLFNNRLDVDAMWKIINKLPVQPVSHNYCIFDPLLVQSRPYEKDYIVHLENDNAFNYKQAIKLKEMAWIGPYDSVLGELSSITDRDYSIDSYVVGKGTIRLSGVDNLAKVPYGKRIRVEVKVPAGSRLVGLLVDGKDIKEEKSFIVRRNSVVMALVESARPAAIEGLDGAEALACYPNPATDFVSLKGLEPQAEVEVYSMVGVCVLRGKADASGSLRLDVRQLAEGLYLVKTGNKTMKLEVKH